MNLRENYESDKPSLNNIYYTPYPYLDAICILKGRFKEFISKNFRKKCMLMLYSIL